MKNTNKKNQSAWRKQMDAARNLRAVKQKRKFRLKNWSAPNYNQGSLS